MVLRISILSLMFLLTSACEQSGSSLVKIGVNPWPGYEFIYLAEQQGFFGQVGLNIQLVRLNSLADTQRAYIHGKIDGFTSTVVEVIQASELSERPLQITLLLDYSNGGDLIVAANKINSMKQLVGEKVGAELSSLGLFLLNRALEKNGLDLTQIELVNVQQGGGYHAIKSGSVAAFVTSPPNSFRILELPDTQVVFSSKEIPFEIIDTLSIANDVHSSQPELFEKLLKAWQLTLEFYYANSERAYEIMAKQQGVTVENFRASLANLKIIPAESQKHLLQKSIRTKETIKANCESLAYLKTIVSDCENSIKILYQPNHQDY